MKGKLKRIFSAFLSAAVVTCTLSLSVVTTSAEETVSYNRDAQSITNIQGHAILHCWNWSFEQIRAHLSEIADAGYKAVQTSPIQPPVDYSSEWTNTRDQWWKLYQPLDFAIPTEEGHSWLGTKSQLTQLCSEAESQYGIKVIVDVVANHLANNGDTDGTEGMSNAEEDTLSIQAAQVWQDNFSTYFHQNNHTHTNGNGDRYNTTQCQMGMPDLNTGNEYVQQRVLDFLEECVDCGVDGFRFDAAKHIELPGESDSTHGTFGSNFWPYVINGVTNYARDIYSNELYIYSEILGDAGSGINYTQYMAVTDNETGNTALYNVRNNNAAGLASSHYYKGSEIEKYVLWAESHDTYNELAFKGYGTVPTDKEIVNTWAIVGARADSTALYFSRHNETMGQASSDDTWKSTAVAEVNKFKNTFDGQGEYLSSLGNTAYIERGTKGVVISKLDGAGPVRLNAAKMADGEYTDHVTNTTFTVSGGVISGNVGESGVAVVYNANDTTEGTTVASMPTKLYLDVQTNGLWNQANANFAVHFWIDGTQTKTGLIKMTDTNNDGIYEADVPQSNNWTNVLFVRLNPAGSISWDSKWNQTPDLELYKDGRNLFIINDWNNGYWNTSHIHQFTGQPTWTWSDNHSSAYAVFSNCTECGKSYAAVATVTSSTTDGITTYTATVSYNGQTYTDTRQIEEEALILYLNTGGSNLWNKDGARFAMDFYNDNSIHSWVDMTLLEGDIYSGVVPAGDWTKVIFCRMDGNTTENNANNRWNRTASLDIPDANGNTLYTVTDWGDKCPGEWGAYTPTVHTHTYGEPVWSWASDCSFATATFTCSDCNEPPVVVTDHSPDIDYISNIRTRAAKVTGPDEKLYTFPVEYEPMVVWEKSTGCVEYQLENTAFLAEIYNTIIDEHPSYIDCSDKNLTVSLDKDKILKSLYGCFPELFDIGFGYSYYEDKLHGFSLHYPENETKADRDEKIAAFSQKADWYLSKIDASMDDFTKALILHELLVENNYYPDPTDQTLLNAANNYDFMVSGWGVCRNYTEVYAYLLARAGIKSEIVSSEDMAHEWLKICLDGSYYNVDVTWDDPASSAGNTYQMRHDFFLLSDSLIGNSNYYSKTHYDYDSYYDTSTKYDSYNNLHKIVTSPFVYLNNTLYTVYRQSDTTIVIATYAPQNDTLGNISTSVNGRWNAGGNYYYAESYSGMEQRNGKLYINGEHTVYEFDPTTYTMTTLVSYNDSQLYGLYIRDNVLYGLSGDTPDGVKTPVALHTFAASKYTVTWKDDDGSILKTEQVSYGDTPDYGEIPTKPSTAQYTYTFAGWTPEVTAVTSDAEYTATYSETVNEYTVIWKNYDGTTLKTEQIPYGTTPSYSGTTPKKENTLEYKFTGWAPAISPVTGNVTYTAQFDGVETINVTVYNFINWDNMYVYYKSGDDKIENYPGVHLTATGDDDNFTFTARIPATADKVIFNNGGLDSENQAIPITGTGTVTDGSVWAVSKNSNDNISKSVPAYYLAGSMNEWTVNDDYKFAPNKNEDGIEEYQLLSVNLDKDAELQVTTGTAWFPGGITNNYTVSDTALYNIYFRPNGNGDESWHHNYFKAKNMTQYTVTFSNDGKTSSQTVYYGETVTEPTAPVKEGYTFAGWYNGENAYDFSTPVTANIALTATWYKDITINEIDINGIVTSKIVHKETFTYTLPNAPYLDGYEFNGWNINDKSYTASHESEATAYVASLIENGMDVTIAVVYNKLNIQHTVSCTVVGCTIKNAEGTVIPPNTPINVSEQLYAIADQNSQGQKFSHWVRIQGNKQTIVGYETTYAFRMPDEDMTLSAVYVDNDATVTKTGTAYIESVKKTGNNEIAFVSVVSVPDGATIKRAGLVISVASLLKDAELTAENSLFESYDSTTCQNYTTFKYTFTVGNVSSHTVCARAYLLYEDETGVQHSVYGDLVTAKISDFNT